MSKLLLESFEGDVIISFGNSENGTEVAIRTKRRDGSGDDYYFISLDEMRTLVENFTAAEAKKICDHLNAWGEPYTHSSWMKGQPCPKCGVEL
jgi:guanylate kinase